MRQPSAVDQRCDCVPASPASPKANRKDSGQYRMELPTSHHAALARIPRTSVVDCLLWEARFSVQILRYLLIIHTTCKIGKSVT